MRHPSLIRRPPHPRLAGRRLLLRPLAGQDFAAWRDVRLRNEDWLLPWEPLRPAGMADPARDRSAFDARCAARDRERAADHAYPFGVFVEDQLAGEVNLNNVTAAHCRVPRSGTGSTAIGLVRATSPRPSSC